MAICRISKRFFSPPEKPSLTLRDRNCWSIFSAATCSLSSVMNCRTGTSSGRVAFTAVRRKLVRETPGISVGYCMARKRPAAARSLGAISVTSSPSKRMEPPVTS